MRNSTTSIFKLIITISVVVIFFSCDKYDDHMYIPNEEEPEEEEIPTEEETDKVINYLALGDSYTIGQNVDVLSRWPNQLGDSLTKKEYKLENIDIIAQTGWTTSYLLNALENADLKEYSLVSLLIGVNNQFQNQPFVKFKAEFDLLLEQSIELAGNSERVFVVSIPDYGVTPFGSSNSTQIGLELDMYNQYISDKCDAENIRFVDITEISRELGDSPGALASDNLHPSGSQYSAWVEKILPEVLDILEM